MDRIAFAGALEPWCGVKVRKGLPRNEQRSARIGGSPDICSDIPSTPVFDWQPVEGASSYILYLSEDANFTNLVEPATALAATSNTRWAPTLSALRSALPESQAGGAYYWHVRPCKSEKSCRPSPISMSNGATNKFRKRSPAVVQTLHVEVVLPHVGDAPCRWRLRLDHRHHLRLGRLPRHQPGDHVVGHW